MLQSTENSPLGTFLKGFIDVPTCHVGKTGDEKKYKNVLFNYGSFLWITDTVCLWWTNVTSCLSVGHACVFLAFAYICFLSILFQIYLYFNHKLFLFFLVMFEMMWKHILPFYNLKMSTLYLPLSVSSPLTCSSSGPQRWQELPGLRVHHPLPAPLLPPGSDPGCGRGKSGGSDHLGGKDQRGSTERRCTGQQYYCIFFMKLNSPKYLKFRICVYWSNIYQMIPHQLWLSFMSILCWYYRCRKRNRWRGGKRSRWSCQTWWFTADPCPLMKTVRFKTLMLLCLFSYNFFHNVSFPMYITSSCRNWDRESVFSRHVVLPRDKGRKVCHTDQRETLPAIQPSAAV